MKNVGLSLSILTAFSLAGGSFVEAALVQVGDLRLSSVAYPVDTYVESFSAPTRAVVDAPVQVNSVLTGTSQNVDTTLSTSGGTRDLSVQTFAAATNLRTISRFAASSTAPRAGAVAWTFDLTPLDGYLSTNNLALNQAVVRLVDSVSDAAYKYDLYLSYTNAAAGLTQANISTTSSADNYANFFAPTQGQAAGSKVGGKFEVLASGATGSSLDLSKDLTSLYNSGTKQFTLILAAGVFGDGRTVSINAGSGLYIDTVAVPEPTAVLGGLGLAGMLLRRRRSV